MASLQRRKYGPPFSIILTALIAGIAAASAAKILKEPLPAYKYGTPTGGHPGGLAEVGDGGRSELVELPDGRMYVTPDYSTILNLPKGTVVKPDAKKELAKIPMAETDKAFKYSFKQIDNSHTIVDGINKGLDGVKRDLVHAIKNQPVPIIDTPNRIKGWVYGNASIKNAQ